MISSAQVSPGIPARNYTVSHISYEVTLGSRYGKTFFILPMLGSCFFPRKRPTINTHHHVNTFPPPLRITISMGNTAKLFSY
jgi:hypothetical protein